jgi:hypothetical protein
VLLHVDGLQNIPFPVWLWLVQVMDMIWLKEF